MYNKLGVVGFCLLLIANVVTAAVQVHNEKPFHPSATTLNNLSVLIPSCDKYSEVWDPFFQLVKRRWPELNQKTYVLGNTAVYDNSDYPNARTITVGEDISWSDNVMKALDFIEEDYVLIILEDYFLLDRVNHAQLAQLYAQQVAEKAPFLHLKDKATERDHPTVPGLGYMARDAEYRTSLQVGIWEKETLRKILKKGESAWLFEIDGTERSRNIEAPFLTVQNAGPISYDGAMHKGYWTKKAIALLDEQGIKINNRKLPIESALLEWYRGPFRGALSKYIGQPIKKLLGIRSFYTDV